MTRCSTWHVRVDVVEDDGQVSARARLVGAPGAMLRSGATSADETLGALNRLLSTWRPLEDLGSVLTQSLAAQHGAGLEAPGEGRHGDAADLPPRRGARRA